jgi:hypothetical protein
MTTELSAEQRQAISALPDGPIEVIDPATRRAYVLVSAEVYARLLAEDAASVREMEQVLADLAPEDWEDPAVYDEPAS